MIKTVEFKGKKYPWRVDYYALKHFAMEKGKEFALNKQNPTEYYEDIEILLFYSIQGECRANGKKFDLEKSDMELLLKGDTLHEVMDDIKVFFQGLTNESSPQKKKWFQKST
jgi:hypothetical protein